MSRYRDAAYEVLRDAGKPLTGAEIVERAREMGLIETRGTTPGSTMAAALYTDIKRGGSRFAKHGPGRFVLSGQEGIPSPTPSTPSSTPPPPERDQGELPPREIKRDVWQDSKKIDNARRNDDHMKIGAAGELRVMSELLLRGYNADRITIDSGIDVRAAKDGKVYEIQVKTVTETKAGNKFIITIRKEAFEKVSGPNVYYVFVLRNLRNGIMYVIIHNSEMKKKIQDGSITENKAGYQVSFSIKSGSLFLRKNNIDSFLNNWDL